MAASFTVEQSSELLAFLLACHTGVPRSRVQKWLKHGSVAVNGQSTTRFNHPLKTGDVVSIQDAGQARVQSLLPAGFQVLLEDSAVIVIEKPVNMLSIATDTEREKTAHAILTHYLRGGNARRPERVWIVHRLDRETSGLMVFARSEAAKVRLQRDWHTAEKRYLAVVEGSPTADSGVLTSHLDESNPFKVFSTRATDATREAITRYRVLQRTPIRTLLEVTLETGRRNQIRVHLSDLGCPIIGDAKYDALTNPARRLGLHASFLEFAHPETGERLKFESPLPVELARQL